MLGQMLPPRLPVPVPVGRIQDMHKVQLHRVRFAVDLVLTARMKMELQQSILVIVNGDCVIRTRTVDLNGVPVVLNRKLRVTVAEINGVQTGRGDGGCRIDVDGRLAYALVSDLVA